MNLPSSTLSVSLNPASGNPPPTHQEPHWAASHPSGRPHPSVLPMPRSPHARISTGRAISCRPLTFPCCSKHSLVPAPLLPLLGCLPWAPHPPRCWAWPLLLLLLPCLGTALLPGQEARPAAPTDTVPSAQGKAFHGVGPRNMDPTRCCPPVPGYFCRQGHCRPKAAASSK